MVPLTHISRPPRWHLRLWTLFLLAPCAWAASLGILFSLTDESCMSGSRSEMWLTAAVCVMLAALPMPFAWRWRREVSQGTAAGERARMMLSVALGGSALFTIVVLLSAVPIALLDTCRT